MCITVNHANLAKTKILSLPLENGNHFIAYSNKVKNLSGKPNAMILPIPGETKQEWFYNTEKYKNFLNEITKKCRLSEDYLGILFRSVSKSKSFESFELGMYTIGLTKNFTNAEAFIAQLPENKRPEISKELADFFREEYDGCSFAVCAFDADKTIDAQPIAFEYKPTSSELLYFPTMDSHDGGAPDVNGSVDTDHTFIFEHTGKMNGEYHQDCVHLDVEVPAFLQDRKYRMIHSKTIMKNGDTFINIDKMSQLDFSVDPQLQR